MDNHNFDSGGHGIHKPKTISKSAKLPSRGNVLCIFDDSDFGLHVESMLMQEHFALLRARHGMHAYWLTLNSKPDLIVTDVMGAEASFLMDCLIRNPETRTIPILGLLDSNQEEVAKAPLNRITAVVRHNIDAVQLRTAADELISNFELTRTDKVSVSNDRVESVDAIFSEIGHAAAKRPKIAPYFKAPSVTTETIGSNSF